MPPHVAAFLDVDVIARAAKDDHALHRMPAVLQRRIDVRLQRHDAAAPVAAVRGDDGDRAAVVDAVLDGLRAEAAEDHGMRDAEPRTREHRDRRLGDHRHVDDDALALLDFVALEHIRKAAHFAMELLVGDDAPLARLAFPDDRRLVLPRGAEMPVEAVLRDIELAAGEPLREGHLPVEHLRPLLRPGEFRRLARPEFLGPLHRLLPHRAILGHRLDAGLLRELLGGLEDAVFDEMRLDVFTHVGGGKWSAFPSARAGSRQFKLPSAGGRCAGRGGWR